MGKQQKNAGGDSKNSYIGVESYGKGADSIIQCRFIDNDLYAIRLDTSDVADYLEGNYVENSVATALNMGIFVNRQSVISKSDTIRAATGGDLISTQLCLEQ